MSEKTAAELAAEQQQAAEQEHSRIVGSLLAGTEESPGETVLYEYYAVQKTDKGFDFHLASEFEVEPEAGRVEERTLDRSVDAVATETGVVRAAPAPRDPPRDPG